MKIRYLALLGMLALAGCPGTTPQAKTNIAIGDACDGYATALDKLQPLKANGTLDAKTIQAIDDANHLVHPICSTGQLPGTSSEATTTFILGETASLVAIAHQHGVI